MVDKNRLYLAVESGASNTRFLLFRYGRKNVKKGETTDEIEQLEEALGKDFKGKAAENTTVATVESKANGIEVFRRAVFEGFNYSVSGEEGLKGILSRLGDILLSVLRSVFRNEFVNSTDSKKNRGLIVGFAAAGIGRSDVKKRFIRDFARVMRETEVGKVWQDEIGKILNGMSFYFMHDGESALWGVFPDGLGVVVNAGTGSIAFGRNERGEIIRAGGWGHIVDDEGSAYWIAIRAISALLKQYDGRSCCYNFGVNSHRINPDEDRNIKRRDNQLKKKVLRFLGLNSIEEIVGWIHQGDTEKKARIASLAKVVTEAARVGDPLAVGVLEDAGRELFELVKAVIDRLGFHGDRDGIGVGMIGSVFTKDEIVRKTFTGLIRARLPGVDVFLSDIEPEIGTARCLVYKIKKGYRADFVL